MGDQSKRMRTNRIQEHIENVKSKLLELRVDQATIILMGSAARQTLTPRSDSDVLVITKFPVPRWRSPIDVHLHMETRDQFLGRLKAGDDFPAWAIRYGKVVHDPSEWWLQVTRHVAATTWPDWRVKVHHAARRLSIAAQALSDGDEEAAQEEYLMAASQVARAILLRAGEFPLSRPELPAQLDAVGHTALAAAMKRLLAGAVSLSEVKQAARVITREHEGLTQLSATGTR